MNSARNLLHHSSRHVRPNNIVRSHAVVSTQCFQMSTKSKYTLDQYHEEKALAKKVRTERYLAKLERKSKLPSRRNLEKKNFNKNQFHKWFDDITSKQFYLDREARRRGLQWKIKVGLMLERLPVVTPDVPQWDEDYQMLKAELSRYDDIAYPKELGFPDPIDREILTRQELLSMLPEGFTPAPRETEADANGFIQTLDRQLKTRVYLSVRPNDETGWTLPITDVGVGETFLEAAKRLNHEISGENLSINCYSNCPMVVDMLEYSDDMMKSNDGLFGEKIFYMRVQYDDGEVDVKKMKKMSDWGWLGRDEIQDRVKAEKGEERALFYKYML